MSYDFTKSRGAPAAVEQAAYITIDFCERLVIGATFVTYIMYIVSAAYPAWPLFNYNDHYWNMQLIVQGLLVVQLSRDAATSAVLYVLRRAVLISLALLIKPFVMLCIEINMCSQLTDAQKLVVATCDAAMTDNYIDANSKLACANLVNIQARSMAHGSCGYLINHVAGMVQAAEFITLVLFTYKDFLLYFAINRCITYRAKASRTS